ncbi:hypothetical protein NQ315_009785 [Exocentrus adspersus]|uniref:Uncharacterized protein n=1 Tax=Exocentrus adspersus TaxID=1586481 RepID=A0AAV8WHL5_9CUCU|nr:hypothetical protein NQ315_009785 [Exocentrus adspersus]
MPGLFHRIAVPYRYFRCVKYLHRQSSRAITGDHVTELNEETLTGRLLNYLMASKTGSQSINNNKETLDILKSNDVDHMAKCDVDQILQGFKSISKPEHRLSRAEFFKSLNSLDHTLCQKLEQLSTSEILNVLHTYMDVIPNRIIEYTFYKKAMKVLYKEVCTLPKPDLIQFMFYVGLQKKSTSTHYMVKKCIKLLDEEFVEKLTGEDLCIICNTTFKTSMKINNTIFLSKVVNYLNDNLRVLKDSAFFVTLIKTLRHNRYQNEELLATISCAVFFNKTIECYSFPALCHILALYSDYLYYDEALIKAFVDRCMELLKSSDYVSKRVYLQEQPRTKDIKRLLWCLSNLNYGYLKQGDLKNVIVPSITKRMEFGEFKNDCATLIEMALYLWMLGYRNHEFIHITLTEQNVQLTRASSNPTRARLNLLLTCMYFEDRNLYNKINIHPETSAEYNMEPQLQKRELLLKVYNTLKSIPAKFEINKYTLACQAPHINIIGITGYRKKIYKAVHIELLDSYTCLKNTCGVPSGLMQLKLRIMEKGEEGIIVISADEIESMSTEELSDFLEDELDLVC